MKNRIYLDGNSLYGYVISEYLSKEGIRWIDPKEFDMNKYTSKILKSCVLEVDLEYTKELRKL